MSEDDTGDVRYLPINLVPVDDIGMESEIEEIEPKSVVVEEKSDDEEKVNRYRRIFLNQQRAQEGRFHKKVKGYIKKQRDKVIPLLINGGKKSIETAEILEQIASIWDDEYARAMTVFTPLIGDSMEVGGRLALSNLGIEREYETARDVVKLRTNRLATNMNETTWKSLRKTIYTGVSEGETINQITDRVKEVYNVRTTSARRIARTEVTGAVNEATFDEYQKVGVQMKQWVGGERETHVENASVGPIPMGAVFPNGQQYPGDPAGGASEVINCRCTLAPIVGE
jgi:SPP1 gp7 family putative phage head morphogenesis protein